MDEILKGCLFVGDYDSSMNVNLLKRNNIRTVVNISDITKPHDILQYYFLNGIEHFHLYSQDHEHDDIDQYFVRILQIMRNNPKPVLFHCHAGISRSATLAIAYIMAAGKIPLKFAHTLVRRQRPRIRPNPGFMNRLKKWDYFLRYHVSTLEPEIKI